MPAPAPSFRETTSTNLMVDFLGHQPHYCKSPTCSVDTYRGSHKFCWQDWENDFKKTRCLQCFLKSCTNRKTNEKRAILNCLKRNTFSKMFFLSMFPNTLVFCSRTSTVFSFNMSKSNRFWGGKRSTLISAVSRQLLGRTSIQEIWSRDPSLASKPSFLASNLLQK